MNKLQDDAKAFLAFWNAMLKYGSEAVTNNLPYLEAMAQGKTVEMRIKEAGYDGAWSVKDYADGWDFSGAVEYRIKPGPEPTYRAYTRDECVEHCLGKVVVNNDWNSVMVVTAITDKMVYNGMDMSGRTFEWLLAKCTHLGGSPCGMKEEPDAGSY